MSINTPVTRYGWWIVKHPWGVILIALICIMAAASGGRLLSFSTSYSVFFSEDNPQLTAFEELENTYTKNDNVIFILTPKEGDVFTEQNLQVVQSVTEQAWQVPYSIRVDSISNFQYTEAVEDDLTVMDLVPEDASLDQPALDKIREVAINEPLLLQRLISEQGHVTGVNVTIQLPGINPVAEVPEVVTFVRNMADEIRNQHPNMEVRLSGMVMMNNAFAEASQSDMKNLVPISFLLMVIMLGLMIRGFTGTAVTVVVIFGSILVAMGSGGYIGYPITPPSASAPTIILTVAIANCVHLLVSFMHQMRRGMDKLEAMVESMRINMQPVFLASATTAIGFLSMNFSDVPPFNHLGNMASIGVFTSFLLSVTLLPALISILPVRVKVSKTEDGSEMMARFGAFVVRKRRSLIWIMTAVGLILITSIPRNELNDVFVHYFDQSVQFRADSDYLEQNLGGLYTIDYSLASAESGGVNKPDFLLQLSDFSTWLRAQPEVVHVNSISDTMARLNKNMHGDDSEYYRQPRERELAAQYLLLYEMSLPYGLDLNNQLNVDKSATRLTVTLKVMSSNELLAFEQASSKWLTENAPKITTAGGSGPTIMFANIGKRNINSMLIGTTLALIMISIILIFALRSLKMGLTSLIPNLVPAAMGFGLWGLLVGEVGLGLSIVAGMTLGIVVDDTVHFLSKYLRARREKGLSPEDSVHYAFANVGYALLTTSVVLIVGFLVLAMSNFYLNSGMGMLTAIVIAFALLADFLLLPPLLMKFEEKKHA